jgi:hypothetical protein
MPVLGDTPLTALTRSLISPEVKNSVFTAVWGKSASSAAARAVRVPRLQEQVRKSFLQVFGDPLPPPSPGAVRVPGLQKQVRNAFSQAFGDNPSTALARSLQRVVQVPELQDHLKEVLLGFSHSDELLARPGRCGPQQSEDTRPRPAKPGGQVLGLAPSAAAAAVLGEQTGIRADTLAKLTWSLQHGELPDWAAAVGPSTLVIIDEAGSQDLAATPHLEGRH